jgi:hypothetical protein
MLKTTPELQQIIAAWPELSEQYKKDILAIVKG